MSTDTICDQPLTIAFCPSIPAVVVVYIISGSGAGQIEPSVDCLLSHTAFITWMVRVQWIQNSNSSKIIQIILAHMFTHLKNHIPLQQWEELGGRVEGPSQRRMQLQQVDEGETVSCFHKT